MSRKKAVVICSGGMDSTVLLYLTARDFDDVLAISFDYGQRHKKEVEFARHHAELLGARWKLIDMSFMRDLIPTSALTSDDIEVPDGHYAEESMKATVVPNRNMMMLSVAGAVAISEKADVLSYGAHAGDHAIYPDCRPEFAHAVADALKLADWHGVHLLMPFISRTKAEVAAQGAELGVDFAQTWTCYKGGDVHCGRCGTCGERREAFVLAGVKDPTVYAEDAPPLAELLAGAPS